MPVPMLGFTSFHSRVARRIFAAFLLCSLLPFAGLVLAAYYQIAAFFDAKSQSQLRDTAKLFGMDAHEKLGLLAASLHIIHATVHPSETPHEHHFDLEILKNMQGTQLDRWNALSLISGTGEQREIFGRLEPLPEPNPSERKHLDTGKALLSVFPDSSNRSARILMTVLLDPGKAGSGRLVGEVKETYLWGFKDSRLLPAHVQLCVQDDAGVRLMCSFSAAESIPQLNEQLARSAIGDIEWRDGDQDYLVSYWTVPMKYEFHVPGWAVLLKASKQGAFASIGDLQKTFILGIVVAVGLSILLAIFQIRKRLVPVDKLKEGTQRIAQSEFGYRVDVHSDDEFEELAASVNQMAGQLGRQFQTLSTGAEIDRAVLSLLNTEKIVETILTRLTAVFPCDFASAALWSADGNATGQTYVLKGRKASGTNGAIGGGQALFPPAPPNKFSTHDERVDDGPRGIEIRSGVDSLCRSVAEANGPLVLAASDAEAADSTLVQSDAARSIMAAPLRVKGENLGVLVFYSKNPGMFGEPHLEFLRGIANQAAIAVYNSQLFERTQRQAVELKKANQAKDEFLGVMSHELRTPLNVTLGYLRMLQEGFLGTLSEQQSQALGTALKHAGELHAMIENIMEVTKLEAGAVVLDKGVVDLVDFLDELKSRYGYPLGKEITLSWLYPANLPAIDTDRAKLTTILENLIGNAIKFTDRGSVSLSARLVAESGSVEFKVADTGIGIPTESQALIFEPFRQLDSSNTREHEGIGLGLYIVRKLAELIGAKISVESAAGQGATFTVSIPIGGKNVIAADSSDAPTLASKLIH
ncbi:MAG: ATP-binding protein [Deltaproteobacteria bacterium]|nr:ATP-binding protein [Deltaproteobacteria bacterium]